MSILEMPYKKISYTAAVTLKACNVRLYLVTVLRRYLSTCPRDCPVIRLRVIL
jgi:hypothetical protein